MMDDFRPGQNGQTDQPNNETNPEPVQNYDQPSEPATPTETPVEPTDTPAAAPVVTGKKKGSVGKWLLGALVVLLLAGLGALAYWQWTEAENAKKEAATLKTSLETAQANLANTNNKEDDAPEVAPLTEDDKIQLAASHFVCVQAGTSCDKVTYDISKKQSPTIDKPGFAIVSAGDAATGAGMKLYLKSTSAGDWVVIYDGQNTPPADIVKKFAIPAEFASQ